MYICGVRSDECKNKNKKIVHLPRSRHFEDTTKIGLDVECPLKEKMK